MVMQGAGELVMKPASARAIERGAFFIGEVNVEDEPYSGGGTLDTNRTAHSSTTSSTRA